MSRSLALVWFVVAAMVGILTVTSASCQSFPDKECLGNKVDAIDAAASPAEAIACTTCLQKECCDLTGTCADQPEGECPAQIKETQRCVIEAGPGGEAKCRASLRGDDSKKLYDQCMRPTCGKQCGLPTCELNAAVTLFGQPSCDRCITGSCCDSINACYKNRRCKLVLECLTDHCPNSLGPALTAVAAIPPDALAAAEATVCKGEGVPGALPNALCIARCLQEYAPENTADTTPEDTEARCRAFGVYTCGAKAGCGGACTRTSILREGAFDEDLDSGRR